MSDETSALEDQIIVQMNSIDKEITKLREERSRLERMLWRARRNRNNIRDVNRVNSLDRVIIESRILQVLRSSKSSVPTKSILHSVIMTNYKINESTFRSHIHRLSKKGLIIQEGGRGNWTVPKSAKD